MILINEARATQEQAKAKAKPDSTQTYKQDPHQEGDTPRSRSLESGLLAQIINIPSKKENSKQIR
jgi:hypothetical protein